jgi:hypothetical protein
MFAIAGVDARERSRDAIVLVRTAACRMLVVPGGVQPITQDAT